MHSPTLRADQIVALDTYLDGNQGNRYYGQPLAQDWARVSKIAEELGEAIQALIGVTGQNPRKGEYGDLDDVLAELCDVEVTAVLAIQHFTKHALATMALIDDRWDYRMRTAFPQDREG